MACELMNTLRQESTVPSMDTNDSGRDPIQTTAAGVAVYVKVVPNASRTEVVGFHGNRVRLRVTAAPERGKANEAVCLLLRLATGADSATIVKGLSSANKTVMLTGVSEQSVRTRISG